MGQNGQNNSIFTNRNIPVLLDSGSSLMYLPNDIVRTLFQKYNARWNANTQAAEVNCNVANQEGSLDFNFSGVPISVPINELVVTISVSRGQPICVLGVAPAGNSISVLGDTFLRSAYVVYDLDNNEISLAQSNFIATSQKGSNGVPNASGVPNAVSTAAVGTAQPRPNGSGAPQSQGAAMPAVTANPWVGGAAALGAGVMLGFNGF
jgi:hypothetical protein